ncbi:MAG: ATP-binding protein [Chloroflexi bacterium]|nr:ATP-binding protein [Chloroflexota bacterium]
MRELSLHILDAMENSVEARASVIELAIDEDTEADLLAITIVDNGRGMTPSQYERAADPFYTTRTTRHVGLGLPLFKAAAERCAGNLSVESELGKGTRLQAVFRHSHIDRAPLGDVAGTLTAIILTGKCDVVFTHHRNGKEFAFTTMEFRAELGDVPLTHPQVIRWIREYIAEGEAELAA